MCSASFSPYSFIQLKKARRKLHMIYSSLLLLAKEGLAVARLPICHQTHFFLTSILQHFLGVGVHLSP